MNYYVNKVVLEKNYTNLLNILTLSRLFLLLEYSMLKPNILRLFNEYAGLIDKKRNNQGLKCAIE